jgi:aryl-alcohol dehydrogenase-like predicted oxidoreductase
VIKRKLGQGLEVSALSLGAMGYGKSRDIPDRAEMIDLVCPLRSSLIARVKCSSSP